MIGGLDSPTEGEVYVDGKKLSSMNREQLAVFRRRKAGFIFQNYNLIPDMNVYDNIVLPVELDGKRIDQKFVKEILELLQLEEKLDALPGMLSGGQQQRVLLPGLSRRSQVLSWLTNLQVILIRCPVMR